MAKIGVVGPKEGGASVVWVDAGGCEETDEFILIIITYYKINLKLFR